MKLGCFLEHSPSEFHNCLFYKFNCHKICCPRIAKNIAKMSNGDSHYSCMKVMHPQRCNRFLEIILMHKMRKVNVPEY